jgi:hypothetical protein
MKSGIIITDVTRMSGQRVCIAGVDEKGRAYRPVFAGTNNPILESWLYDGKRPAIYPFARVEFDFLKQVPDAPHTEDWIVNQDFKRLCTTHAERRRLLAHIADSNVASIFGTEIHHEHGYYVKEGEGNRSLGTVKANVLQFTHTNYDGRWDYRIQFSDAMSQKYSLKVTDLSFVYYINHLREKEKLSTDKISQQLTLQLLRSETYLRIGLARPTWIEHPHCCYLQITGVYTFPDYLGGRCFADFRLQN